MQALLCPTLSLAAWSLLFSAVASFSPNPVLWGTGNAGCFPVTCWGHWRLLSAHSFCLSILTTLPLLQLILGGGEDGAAWKSHLWEPYCFLSHALPFLHTLEDFMGMGGKAGKTGSSGSQIFLNIFCLTPGLRVLNLKPQNVIPVLWLYQDSFPKVVGVSVWLSLGWSLRWKQGMQGGWVRGHSLSYTQKVLFNFSHNPLL